MSRPIAARIPWIVLVGTALLCAASPLGVIAWQVSTPTPAGAIEIQPVDNYVLVFRDKSFNLVCKTPADIYFWSGSRDLEILPQGAGAQITAVKDGEGWVKVTGMTINWDNRQFETSEGMIPFIVDTGEKPAPDDPDDPDPVVTELTQVTYIWDKEEGQDPPSEITMVLGELDEHGLHTAQIESEATTGDGNFPSQYEVARIAAMDEGLPALVFQAAEKVVSVLRAPTTRTEVMNEYNRLISARRESKGT